MDVTIRKITKRDMEDLSKVYDETILKEFFEYSLNVRKYFVKPLYKNRMLVLPVKYGAFVEGKLKSFLIAEEPVGGVLYVLWLAVLQPYQRKGIGKKLLAYAEKEASAAGVHAIHLQSDKRNVAFYEKCGFTVYGFDEKGYFGADDYLMKKVLREPQEEAFLR